MAINEKLVTTQIIELEEIYTLILNNTRMIFELDKYLYFKYGKRIHCWFATQKSYKDSFMIKHCKDGAAIGITLKKYMLYVHFFNSAETKLIKYGNSNLVLLNSVTEFLDISEILYNKIGK